MTPNLTMKRIIDGFQFDTTKAVYICGDDWWDGHNQERNWRNTHLFRTPNGRYFFQHLTQVNGEADRIEVCTDVEAKEFYESVQNHTDCVHCTYEEAFPESTIIEA